jgi:hypothetical protein
MPANSILDVAVKSAAAPVLTLSNEAILAVLLNGSDVSPVYATLVPQTTHPKFLGGRAVRSYPVTSYMLGYQVGKTLGMMSQGAIEVEHINTEIALVTMTIKGVPHYALTGVQNSGFGPRSFAYAAHQVDGKWVVNPAGDSVIDTDVISTVSRISGDLASRRSMKLADIEDYGPVNQPNHKERDNRKNFHFPYLLTPFTARLLSIIADCAAAKLEGDDTYPLMWVTDVGAEGLAKGFSAGVNWVNGTSAYALNAACDAGNLENSVL